MIPDDQGGEAVNDADGGERTKIGRWLEVEKLPPTQHRKTCAWIVHSSQGGGVLGEVRYHTGWRRYVLVPEDAIFEETCLRDIAEFLVSVRGVRSSDPY